MVYGDDEQVVRDVENITEVEREDGWPCSSAGPRPPLRVQQIHVQSMKLLRPVDRRAQPCQQLTREPRGLCP
jgi:hypothetical protein